MADPALASISDVAARGVDVSDAARVQAAIQDASAQVHFYSDRAWVTGDVPDLVVAIVCRAVADSLAVPAGVTHEQLADYSATYTKPFLYRAEISQIRALAGQAGGLAVLSTTRGELETDTVASAEVVDVPDNWPWT